MMPEYVPNDQGVKFAKEMESLKEKKKKDSLQHIKLEADFSWKNLFINTLKKGRPIPVWSHTELRQTPHWRPLTLFGTESQYDHDHHPASSKKCTATTSR